MWGARIAGFLSPLIPGFIQRKPARRGYTKHERAGGTLSPPPCLDVQTRIGRAYPWWYSSISRLARRASMTANPGGSVKSRARSTSWACL